VEKKLKKILRKTTQKSKPNKNRSLAIPIQRFRVKLMPDTPLTALRVPVITILTTTAPIAATVLPATRDNVLTGFAKMELAENVTVHVRKFVRFTEKIAKTIA
jgi:hypothetical protein